MNCPDCERLQVALATLIAAALAGDVELTIRALNQAREVLAATRGSHDPRRN